MGDINGRAGRKSGVQERLMQTVSIKLFTIILHGEVEMRGVRKISMINYIRVDEKLRKDVLDAKAVRRWFAG